MPASPGTKSLTNTVPASVPSLFQSSVPVSGVNAGKIISFAFKFIRLPLFTAEADDVVLISFTCLVFAVVPSVFHNSMPPAGE